MENIFDRFAFADGLGGEMNGSLLTVDSLPARFDQRVSGRIDTPERYIGGAEWNSECKLISQAKIMILHGMGRPQNVDLDSFVRIGNKLFGFERR